jgi:hypothetical protein
MVIVMEFWRSDWMVPIVYVFLVELMILGWINYAGVE